MKFRWWILLIALGSLAGTVFIYPQLPETVATHWDAAGQVNGTGPRSVQLLLGALPLGLYALLVYVPRLDPHRANYTYHEKAYTRFQLMLVLLLVGVNGAAIAYNLGFAVDIRRATLIPMGILFMVLGNYMGQIRHNYFFGIRTPWTLANEEVWRRTHRLGGYLFALSGLAVILSALVDSGLSFPITLTAILLSSLGSVVYSYFCFRKLQP